MASFLQVDENGVNKIFKIFFEINIDSLLPWRIVCGMKRVKGVKAMKLKVIYEPSGRAAEYAPLAFNPRTC